MYFFSVVAFFVRGLTLSRSGLNIEQAKDLDISLLRNMFLNISPYPVCRIRMPQGPGGASRGNCLLR